MAPPERTCPACATRSATLFETCPACGARFDGTGAAARRRPRGRALAVAALATLAAGAGAAALLAGAADRRAADDARLQEAIRAERARLERVQAPKRGAAPELRPAPGASDAERRRARAALVRAAERSVLRDAQARVRTGELDAPVAVAECTPRSRDPRTRPDDEVLSRPVGRYDCLALRRRVPGLTGRRVADLGFPFVAALDFRSFTYVWCRDTPAQGEAGKALAFVRLDRACLAAKGAPLGSGYVDVPD